jgi:CheY-like chemotaxis protein
MAFWRPQPDDAGTVAEQRQPAIVVVDDDRDTRELYRAFFDLCGFQTAEASNGSQALLISRRLLPDVLLMDLVLPDVDGLSVARVLKADPDTAGIHVLLVTGYAFDKLGRCAVDAGVERALTKPCLPQAMLREVRRVLGRPAASSSTSEHASAGRNISIRNQQHDRARPVIDSKRQNL